MNTDVLKFFLQPKSCCYFLSLRTGCCIIGGLYWVMGSMFFYDELAYFFHYFSNVTKPKFGVLFFYDVNPTIFVIFTTCLFYGLYKENRFLIFSMYSMILAIEFELIFRMIVYLFTDHYFPPILFVLSMAALNGFMVTIVYAHVKNVMSNKKAGQMVSNSSNEFENPNYA